MLDYSVMFVQLTLCSLQQFRNRAPCGEECFSNVFWTLNFSLLVDKYVRKFSVEALIVVL